MVSLNDEQAAMYDPDTMEKLLEMVEKAPSPGIEEMDSPSAIEILHRGDESFPAPIVRTAMKEAQWVFVYNRFTGDRSVVNSNMLPAQLRKIAGRDDPYAGERVFTTVDPKIPQLKGTHPCMLHHTYHRRSEFDELGFPVCLKEDLDSEYQQTLHMEHRHSSEFRTIRYREDEAQKLEDRNFQRSVLSRAAGTLPEPLTAPEVPTREEEAAKKAAVFSDHCTTCGHVLEAKSKVAVYQKKKAHIKKEHPGVWKN